MVDSKCEDPNLKLSRLLQYTSGRARESIKKTALIQKAAEEKLTKETEALPLAIKLNH